MTGDGRPGDGRQGDGPVRRERPGRRALFSDPVEVPATEEQMPTLAGRRGRQAFFSGETAPSGGNPVHDRGTGDRGTGDRAAGDQAEGGRGPVVVCRTCLARTPMSMVDLGRALVPSLWLPTRPWSRLMRCPACHRVSWCRLEWSGS